MGEAPQPVRGTTVGTIVKCSGSVKSRRTDDTVPDTVPGVFATTLAETMGADMLVGTLSLLAPWAFRRPTSSVCREKEKSNYSKIVSEM